MSSTEWEQEVYRSTYDKALAALARRKQEDPSFGESDLRGILEHLYVQQGNDHYGRGRLHDLSITATVDAHEDFLNRLQKE
ncbi:MAG: hypothetical protein KKI09_09285 [Spirochaetes bacterium]|nr:hypothetical protein [Spirochaetota bacterium]MBU0955606.1 hypothetical protein [Spirochaetota bacterium]